MTFNRNRAGYVDPAPDDPREPAAEWVALMCELVAGMRRATLDRFTRWAWRRYDPEHLEPLKAAVLARRVELDKAGDEGDRIKW